MKNVDSAYISLKQAAALSGYTPDYVGQLIRQGKLPGKQIFSNVAWVTTEEDLRAYMERKAKPPAQPWTWKGMHERFAAPEFLTRLIRPLLWASILGAGTVVLFLAFLVAVSIDHSLEAQSLTTEYVSE